MQSGTKFLSMKNKEKSSPEGQIKKKTKNITTWTKKKELFTVPVENEHAKREQLYYGKEQKTLPRGPQTKAKKGQVNWDSVVANEKCDC